MATPDNPKENKKVNEAAEYLRLKMRELADEGCEYSAFIVSLALRPLEQI